MTTDELRRLAEIAGLKYEETLGGTIFIDSLPVTNAVWQPHLRIEQAMMVAEAFRKQGYVIDIVLWPDGDAVVAIRNKFEHYSETEENTSLAICRAALAAAKED